jgi:hypothetical protein
LRSWWKLGSSISNAELVPATPGAPATLFEVQLPLLSVAHTVY